MLRLFSILEVAIEDMACKLVAGAPYGSGRIPARLNSAKSLDSARNDMLSYGRKKPLQYLRWTSAQAIVQSTSYVLSNTDPFIQYA